MRNAQPERSADVREIPTFELHGDGSMTIRANLEPAEFGVFAEATFRVEAGRLVCDRQPIVWLPQGDKRLDQRSSVSISAHEQWLRKKRVSVRHLEVRLRECVKQDPRDPGIIDPKNSQYKELLNERKAQGHRLTEEEWRIEIEALYPLGPSEDLLRQGLPAGTREATRAGRPRIKVQLDHVEVLASYLELCRARPAGGVRPALAAKFGCTTSAIDQALRDAERAGLWRRNGQGKLGGRLTPQGQLVIEARLGPTTSLV